MLGNTKHHVLFENLQKCDFNKQKSITNKSPHSPGFFFLLMISSSAYGHCMETQIQAWTLRLKLSVSGWV